jgi:MurNAc alpha-1-phosphate uridylyltransferase
VHHFAERLTLHLEPRIAPQITISDETDTLLETGGGLVRARNHLGLGPIYTLNADTLWVPDGGRAFLDMAAQFEPTRMAALLLLARREDAVGYAGAGDFFLNENGRLERRGSAVAAPFVYAGAQILSLASIHGLAEERFSLNRIWDDLLADGLLYGHVLESRWLHVGDPEARDAAEEVLRAQAPA